MKIKCPKCYEETEFFTGDAIDELGEVFSCQHCKWPFRYVEENKKYAELPEEKDNTYIK